jgi:hypothetical protein
MTFEQWWLTARTNTTAHELARLAWHAAKGEAIVSKPAVDRYAA